MIAAHKADPAKFITRGEHEQYPGYAPWLAHALDRVYVNPPRSARELVENSAFYMQDRAAPAWKRILAESRERMRLLPLNKRDDVFGPAADEKYGKIQKKKKFVTGNAARGYYKTLARHYPDEKWVDGEPVSFGIKEFSYPVPGTDRHLRLMRIGMEDELFPNDEKTTHTLIFSHPNLPPAAYKDFIGCLEPLFATIHNTDSSADQRQDAAITFFWLMAQMTPTFRGGTAHARIALEYLASKAGFAVPHIREGIDLWAEAASQNMESFKASFKAALKASVEKPLEQNDLFDPAITSQDVFDWQQAALHNKAIAAMKEKIWQVKDENKKIKQFAPQQLEQEFLTAVTNICTAMKARAEPALLPEYYDDLMQQVVTLSLLANRLRELPSPRYLQRLESFVNASDANQNDFRLKEEDWHYIKGKFYSDILPSWERQLAEKSEHIPYDGLRDMISGAIRTVRIALPDIIANAQAPMEDDLGPQTRNLRRKPPAGTLSRA